MFHKYFEDERFAQRCSVDPARDEDVYRRRRTFSPTCDSFLEQQRVSVHMHVVRRRWGLVMEYQKTKLLPSTAQHYLPSLCLSLPHCKPMEAILSV